MCAQAFNERPVKLAFEKARYEPLARAERMKKARQRKESHASVSAAGQKAACDFRVGRYPASTESHPRRENQRCVGECMVLAGTRGYRA